MHLRASCDTSERFFREEADAVAHTCRDMAKRFHRGGRLLVFGSGGARSDAYHVSVEFVHPVLVGKRALPALVVEGEPAVRLPVVGRPEDIALGIRHRRRDERSAAGLAAAGELGLLTIHLLGGIDGSRERVVADHRLVVRSDDPSVVQEVQETLYHVLWELVHVFFEHRGLL